MKFAELEKTKPKKALIYCRVSDPKQKTQGSGLDSQEHRCRQYAAIYGFKVVGVFPDDITGGGDFMKRPGMLALLNYLDAHPEENFTIIFDDLKRLARDRENHFRLRTALKMRHAEVECLNYKFDDSPEGEFVETIFAAQGQLERKQNQRQVIQKMRARVEKGYYCFPPVLGYTYKKIPGGGRMIAPDELSPLITNMLEGFAAGQFQTATEAQRYLERQPAMPKNAKGEVRLQRVIDILRSPLYAGYITIKKWDIHLHPGKHEPLISFATWQRIQERLDGTAHAPIRKDLNADFPLRGFVECDGCGHPLTAGWSKGRRKSYAYYTCQQKGCCNYKKSIRKADIEGRFEDILKTLQPAPQVYGLARALFKQGWDAFSEHGELRKEDAKAALAKLEAESAKLVQRIIATDSEALANAYETQLKNMEEQKIRLQETIAQAGQPRATFETLYRTACGFLSNPYKLWASGKLEHQRLVLRLAFPKRLSYCRNEGYRTAAIAEPFRVLGDFCTGSSGMVELGGIEPPTSSLRTTRSTN